MAASLELRDVTVTFVFGPSTVTALDAVSLSVDKGEFLTIIGSNGAGKSTLINTIAGRVSPKSGTIRIGDREVRKLPEHRRAALISRVFQGPTTGVCPDLTVAENMMLAFSRGQRRSMFRPALRRSRIETARARLAEFGVGLENSMKRPAALLSGGQQQLLALVMAGLTEPQLLLLDEHTSALDPKMAELVMTSTNQMVHEMGVTTVMVTHNMRHAATYGDRLVIMDAGSIVGEIRHEDGERIGEDELIATFRKVTAGKLSDSMLN